MYTCEYTPALPAPKFVTVWRRGPAESFSRNTHILNFSGINTGYCTCRCYTAIYSLHKTFSILDDLCSGPQLLKQPDGTHVFSTSHKWQVVSGKEFTSKNVEELNSLKPVATYELSV